MSRKYDSTGMTTSIYFPVWLWGCGVWSGVWSAWFWVEVDGVADRRESIDAWSSQRRTKSPVQWRRYPGDNLTGVPNYFAGTWHTSVVRDDGCGVWIARFTLVTGVCFYSRKWVVSRVRDPQAFARGLLLASTATQHTWRRVLLWLHRPQHQGTLTKYPSFLSLAEKGTLLIDREYFTHARFLA